MVRGFGFHLNLAFIIVSSGIPHEMLLEDSQLGGKRNELIQIAAKKLAESRMISYDAQQGQFLITDIGRIAARYYIRHASIEIFNKEFKPKMSEADVLAMLSMSTEARIFFLKTRTLF
jgi:antiviral helicase SLH1